MTIYSTTFDTNNSPSEEMKKSEEYVAAATLAAFNEEFHTDKNIVKGHTNFKFNKTNEKGDLPCPMLQDGCNQDEFR